MVDTISRSNAAQESSAAADWQVWHASASLNAGEPVSVCRYPWKRTCCLRITLREPMLSYVDNYDAARKKKAF